MNGDRQHLLIRRITAEVLRRLSHPEERRAGPVSALIDHTLLRADATVTMIRRLCDEAVVFGFAAVCVNPIWVSTCVRALVGRSVRVCTVVGFPLGANRSPIKCLEAERARGLGAHEIDMVINVGALKSGRTEVVSREINEIRTAIGSGATLKVILETALLTDAEKWLAGHLAVDGGADFLKTSTGFGPGGATVEDVRLLADVGGGAVRVKASGGISNLDTARRMVEAGAARIGTSSGVAIAGAEAGIRPFHPNPLRAST